MSNKIHIKSLQFTHEEIAVQLHRISKNLVVLCVITFSGFLMNAYLKIDIAKIVATLTTLIVFFLFIKKRQLYQKKGRIKKRIENLKWVSQYHRDDKIQRSFKSKS